MKFASLCVRLTLVLILTSAMARPTNHLEKSDKRDPISQVTRTDDTVGLDPTYTAWFDRRLAVVEANVQGQEDASSRLQTVLALSGILLGGLITFVVVFFALRTERTASAAAAEAARKAIAEDKGQIEAQVRAVEKIKLEADEALAKIRAGRGEADTHVSRIKAALKIAEERQSSLEVSSERLSQHDERELRQGAEQLEMKNPSDWSFDDFKILTSAALDKKKWDRAIELAWMLRSMHNDDASVAYSMNIEALAAGELAGQGEAIPILEELVAKYEKSTDQPVKRLVAVARRNLAFFLQKVGRPDDSMRILDEIIASTDLPDDQTITRTKVRARYTRSFVLKERGELIGAAIDLKETLTFWDMGDSAVRLQIAKSLLTRSHLLEQMSENSEAIVELEEWIPKIAQDKRVADEYLSRLAKQLRRLKVNNA